MNREEQIELMKECVADAISIGKNLYLSETGVLHMASVFFQYRARYEDAADIPCDTPSKAADVEKD